MFGLAGHVPELLIILALVLLLFGAKSLPGLARGMGQSLTEFRKANKDDQSDETKPDNAKADA